MSRGAPALSLIRLMVRAGLLSLLLASAAFTLIRLSPSDFAETTLGLGASQEVLAQQRAVYGLDRPILVQYLEWLSGAARLDFGESWLYRRPVTNLVAERALNTLGLSVAALTWALAVGALLGTWRAATSVRPLARMVDAASALVVSLPALLTTLVLGLLGARTDWYVVGGPPTDAWLQLARDGVGEMLRHLFLPLMAMGLPVAAAVERIQADAIRESRMAPCLEGLRARGVSLRRQIWVHATRLAAAPVASMVGLLAANVLNGALTVELFLGWPGLGRLLIDALAARDSPLVVGCVTASTLVVTLTLAATGACADQLDPRSRTSPAVERPR